MSFNPFVNGGGGTSSEDKVARAEIAAIKDGETLDSFGDVETALGDKADTSTTYTKTEVDTALSAKANSADVYSKTAVDTALGNKADKSTTYTKTEVDTALSAKADKSTTYTKTEVDTALDDKVDKETGKGLSTNDYTTAEKTKLASIEAQANKTTVDDVLSGSSTNPVQNKVVKSALDSKANISDIPTVPITAIQKNGTGIIPLSGTVNITVPTSAADVSALPDTTKYAAALSLTINSSTFVMTGQLKDQNGDNLGTAQTIDLPLESVVVGGSYNSQTKKVVLTLQNGNTIEFSVADLVSGLQTELSASNKLNPAYINYDSAHRAVSDTEKSAWNSKQNALSSTQLDAVNSGIDSTKVAQIETNKNNILTIADQTTKYNICDYTRVNTAQYPDSSTGATISFDSDSLEYNINGTTNSTGILISNIYFDTATTKAIPNGEWVAQIFPTLENLQLQIVTNNILSNGNRPITFTVTDDDTRSWARLYLANNKTFNNAKTKLMIIPKSLWDAGFTDYQPYAMNNAELTVKEQQNENNILYNTDNGVKNTFDFANAPQEANFYTTVSKTATSLTVTANNSGVGASSVVYSGKNYPAGDYIFSCKITDYSCTTETAKIYISTSTAAGTGVANKTITGNGTIQIPFHWNGGKVYIKYFPNESNTANQFNTFTASENMIMLASISDTTYQPYAMSNAELTAQWSSKQVSKWVTSFSVPNPSFGQGELIKLYVYGGNPASLAMYLITSNTVVPLTSTTGISYTIQTNTSVDFTTTSTCLAYYEYIRFATS